MILSLDASLTQLSIALVQGQELVGALSVRSEGARNEKLLPLLDMLLRESGTSLDEVTRVVATRGPGSFTGTRVGLATAQGMALGCGVPLSAMSTHEAAAWSQPAGRVVVASEAGRGELYFSSWQDGVRVEAEQLFRPEAFVAAAALADHEVHVESLSSTANVALLAARKIVLLERESRLSDYSDATPIYVRLAEAEVQLKARNG